jgi:ABC-type multidrug transport system fused ATPase/permease subunit
MEKDKAVGSDTLVQVDPANKPRKRPRGTCCGKKKKKNPSIPYSTLLRYDKDSQWLVALGFIFAIMSGSIYPLFSLVFGSLFNQLFTKTGDELNQGITFMSLMFLVIAVGSFVVTYLRTLTFSLYGERVARKMKKQVLESLLEQEIGYYDQTKTGDITSKIASDIDTIAAGVSDKLGLAIMYLVQFAASMVIAFVSGWKMTLVMLATSPIVIASGAMQLRFFMQSAKASQKHTGKASQLVQESITGIRTVYSFVAETALLEKFTEVLNEIYRLSVKRSHLSGASAGFGLSFMFGIYALGFWYGGQLVQSGEMLGGSMLTVFFAITIGAMGLGMASQLTPDVAKAQGLAVGVFAIINRKTEVDVNQGTGRKLDALKGVIKFNNVKFHYPSRKEARVLKGLSLEVQPGQTVALVGPSGGGKSTTVQLLERFYDPVEGDITIDGVDLKEFDLRWLRSQIGLVSQEPILFGGTVAENIRYGKINATDEEVISAAKMANAHTFIVNDLDKGYETDVGEKGAQLSGGQKQRIAIARAILKDPKILLLDEATSALDSESEGLVQDALDKLMVGRTTIVIAHRLTTIKNADVINVIAKGTLLESGTHSTLLAAGGVYSKLVRRQVDKEDEEELLKELQVNEVVQDASQKEPESASTSESSPTKEDV